MIQGEMTIGFVDATPVRHARRRIARWLAAAALVGLGLDRADAAAPTLDWNAAWTRTFGGDDRWQASWIDGTGVTTVVVARDDGALRAVTWDATGAVTADVAIDTAGAAVRALVVDASGDLLLAGMQFSATTFRDDAWAARYDAAGSLLWWGTYDPGENTSVTNAALDSAGNLLVSGTFGDGTPGASDALLASWSGAGAWRWATTYDSGFDDEGTAVAADASGNAFLVGFTNNTVMFAYDPFAVTVDSAGVQTDSAVYGGGFGQFRLAGGAAWRAATNELYIGGSDVFDAMVFRADATNLSAFTSATYTVPGDFVFPGGIAVDSTGRVLVTAMRNVSGLNYDFAMYEFTAALAPGWTSTFDAGGLDAYGWPVAAARVGVDAADNVYASAPVTPSGCVYDAMDVFIRAWSPGGVVQWTAAYDGPPVPAPGRAAVDGSGDVYLGVRMDRHAWLVKHSSAGAFQWAVEPSFAGLCAWDRGGVAHAGGSVYYAATGINTTDYFLRARVAEFSSAGAQTQTFVFDRILDASAGPVVVDAAGGVYLAGSFRSSTTLEDELYVVKFNSAGTIVWTLTRSTAVDDWPGDLALDGAGGLYVLLRTPADGIANDVPALLKLNATTGAVVWSRTYEISPLLDSGALGVAASGSEVYVAGWDEDPDVRLWGRLTRLTSAGDVVWSVTYDGGADAALLGVAIDPLGHVDVVGQRGDYLTDTWDALTASFDRQGGLRWDTAYDSGAPEDWGSGIALGSVYLGGRGGTDVIQLKYTEPAAAALFASLSFAPAAIKAGEWAQVVLTVTNAGNADADLVVPLLDVTSGLANVNLEAGPVPAGPLTIGAGTAVSFTWTFSMNGGGNASFTATATGDDAGLAITVLGAASGTLFWVPPCTPGLSMRLGDAEPPYAGGGQVQTWRLAFSNPGTVTVYNAVLTTRDGSFDQRSYVAASLSVTVTGGTTVSPLWAGSFAGPWSAGEPPGGTGVYLRWVIPQLDPGRSGVLSWRTTLLGGATQRLETYISATGSCDPAGTDFGEVAYTATGAGMRIAPPLAWRTQDDGGPAADDRYHAVAKTPGGFVAVGSASRPDLAQGRNWLVRSFSATGTLFWEATYNAPANGDDEATAVAADAAGNVYVAGFESRPDLSEGENWVVRAYAAAGGVLWMHTYNSPAAADERALGVAVNAAGWVWAVGFEDRPDLGQGRDMYFEVLDAPTGAVLAGAGLNSPGNGDEAMTAVTVSDAAGLTVIAGWEDDPLVGLGRDWRVYALDAGGSLVWTRTLDGGPGGVDEARGVGIHGALGVVTVAGFTDRSDLTQDRNWTVRSYDRDGNVLWQSDYDSPASGADEAAGAAVSPAGSLGIAGHEARPDLGTGDDWRYRRFDNAGNVLDSLAHDGLANGDDRAGGIALSGTVFAVVAGWEATRQRGADAVRARYDVTPFAYPQAPPNLTVRAAGPVIGLQWALPAAGTRAVAGFRLFRATSPNVPFSMTRWHADVAGGSTSVFVDAAVTSGVRFYYRLVAVDALGAWSALSNEGSAQLGAAALQASLAVTPFQGVPGQMFSIVLSVTNTGLAFAELVLPELGITTGAGSVTIFYGPSLSGTVSLSPGSATRFEWTATGTAFGFVEFSATVNGWDAGLLTGIGAASTATLLIAPLGVLSVTMTIDPPTATVYVGQWITVTLSVTNTGGLIVQNVLPVAQYVLPGGLVWQDGPSPSGPLDLAPGGATTFVWTYSVSGNGLLVFTGSVGGDDGGMGRAAAWATDSRILARPGRLSGHLSVTPGTAPAGVTVTVRATITNTGDEAVTGVWMPDFSWTTTGDLVLSMLTGAVPAGPMTLPGQTTTVFEWTFTTSGEGSVTFSGTAFGQDLSVFAFSRTVTLNRTACVIPLGVLTGRLKASPDVVTEGGTIRLVFTVSNSGANPIWTVTAAGAPAPSATFLVTPLTGPLPPVDPQIGGCAVAGCVVDRTGCPQTRFTWTFLAVGSGTVDFSASVFWTEPVFGMPFALADVSNTVFIMPAPRLVASAAVDPATVRYGRPVTFTLTVTNTGGATVWNLLPALVPPDPALVRVDLAPAAAGATLANGASTTFTWLLTALDGGTPALQASVAGIYDSVSGTIPSTAVASASAGAMLTITPRPEGDLVVFPHPVTTDRASVFVRLTEDAVTVELEAWDSSMHRVYEGEWRNVSWLDGLLTLEGMKRWAPGVYLLRVRATFADGTVKTWPVSRLVVKP